MSARHVTSIPTIQLYRRPDAWHIAIHAAARPGMGSIPTAYGPHTPTAEVFRAISDLNPDAIVEVRYA